MSEFIGYLLHDTARLFRRNLEARMQRGGLSWLQWRILANVARHEGINQANLAEHVEVEPITISRTVDRLAAAGFIERRPDPSDRRAYGLFLLPSGHEIVDRLRAEASIVGEVALQGFSTAENDELSRLLQKMSDNLAAAQRVGRTDSEEAA